MARAYDAVLLLAFGGPESPGEIRPFLARVLHGVPVAPSRFEEIAHHYEAVGGRSPLNELTFRQAAALEISLKEAGSALPVYVGMRFASPFIRETLERMATADVKRALGLILSPHQTEASWERYQKSVAAARDGLGERCPEIDYCPGWHGQPLFIQAWTQLIRDELEKISRERLASTPLVFTAHSVPVAMADRSPYVEQIRETASLIAAQLGHSLWRVAYQSRSGNPREAWLEPDVLSMIHDFAARGVAHIVVAPIGFVCDHVEVLYDLDIEGRGVADNSGIGFYRARCVNDHPLFIRMMVEVLEEKMGVRR
ncbi:MAG: ferrochelatase [Candidatus Binatia bacterium]